MRRRSSLLLIVVAVMVVTITPGTAGPHDEPSRGSAPEMSIRPLDEDGVAVPERYADDHDEVYYRLTGQTAGFVVAADAENIGVVAHLDVIAGPGRGQRVDCVRTGESEGECDSQLRTVDAPGSVPTNPFNLFYWREEVPGTSEVVLWVDRNGNGIREDAEIEDTARVEWLSPLSHLTLGDSYTSGTGIQEAYQPLPHEQCLRSTLAYGWQIRRRAPDGRELQAATGATDGADFRYVPCSGARVQNVLDVPFRGAPPQLEEALLSEVDPFAELVTMTIGGNDLRFADILLHCLRNVDLPVVPDDERFCFDQPLEDRDSTTLPTLAETFPDLLEDLRLLLSNLYAELRVRAPNAVIVQAGYPLVIDPATTDCYGIAPEEVTWIVETNRAANSVIRGQVEANGGIYADAEATFLGHGACTAEPWVRGISTWGITNPGGPTEHSFHPNALGHRFGYAAAFNAAIDAGRQTYGVQDNGLPNRIARFATDQPAARPATDSDPAVPDSVVEAQLTAGQDVCTVGGLPPDTGFTVSADVFAPGSAVTVRGTTGTGGGFGPLELTADGTGAVLIDRTTGADGVFVVEFAGTSGTGSPVTAATQAEIVAEPCDDGAPSVSISSPADGAVFAAGEEISISYDCGSAVVCDGTLPVGTRTRAAGAYELRVTAISDEGVATTEEVSFSVGTPLRTTVRAVPDDPGQFEVVVEREAGDSGARALVATTLTAAGDRSIVTTFNLQAGQSDARTVVELPVREPAALGVSSRSPQGWEQTTTVVPSSPTISVDRLQGSSRYATAAAAAAAAYPQGASTVLLARADDPADAFAASTLSLAAGAPVLLTDWDRLNEETRAALQDLDVDEVVLLGGTSAISPAVEAALTAEWSVERVAGAERTETAALISALSQQALGTGSTAIVVPARRWEPALAATGLARAVAGPILLAEDAGLSGATLDYLASSTIERVIAVDPTGSTATELSSMGLDVDVLTADSITELSTVLAAATHAADPQARTYLVATTGTFADALAAGGLVSPLSASVLLVDDGSIVDEWVRSTDFVDRLIVMGGPAAVSEETVSRIRGDG